MTYAAAKKIMLVLFVSLITGGAMNKGIFAEEKFKKATFAGGCFWCMEYPFEKLPGVIDVVSGYMGGKGKDPTYQDYAEKGHTEVVQITYDSEQISYQKLLDVFWRQINPTDTGGQFGDRGSQYSTAVFYHSQEQKEAAEKSKKQLEESGKFDSPIVTQIRKTGAFYKAEDYHQDYYKKYPCRYKVFKVMSGRQDYINQKWGKDSEKAETADRKMCPLPAPTELKERLTPLQYRVTQQEGTELPFKNEYWDNTREGIYVDVVSGEPLFSSKDKFKSGTGWPSFTNPLEPENIIKQEDNSLSVQRTEVRSKKADSHLGHVFDDGPSSTGKRYCINSAALRFIPKEDLKKEGYEEYSGLFEEE